MVWEGMQVLLSGAVGDGGPIWLVVHEVDGVDCLFEVVRYVGNQWCSAE